MKRWKSSPTAHAMRLGEQVGVVPSDILFTSMPIPKRQLPERNLRSDFEQLAISVLPALNRSARRMARAPQDGSDLVQETLLRAYRTFANFVPGTNGKAWLFTILYSVAANFAERTRRHPEVQMDDIDQRFAAAMDGDHADEELALVRQIDTVPHIDAALNQLSDDFRNAVLLVDVEELTYEEAASVLKCPVGTVRSRLFRARRQLFLALREHALRAGLLKGG